MTEAEKKSFFQHANARGPGKRQIKPTAAVMELVLPAEDEEDDDEYIGEEKAIGSGDSGSESSSSSDSDEDEQSDEGEETEEGAEKDTEDEPTSLVIGIGDGEDISQQPLVCALCLSLREGIRKEELMQCDRCGVCVHESCYLPDIGDDAASSSSSASTEPWFCEPCAYGLVEPPHCEFCPDRHGAFKRSDIGGGWAHLLCALYTPGVTFGDVDHLGAVSWQEMDHRNFGRKSCSGCTNKLEARTGVAIRCEVGMCKHYYHATCAQRLGLLVDLIDTAKTAEEVQSVDPRYITCKKHSNPDHVKVKRAAYLKWLAQEERRLLRIRRTVLKEREEEQRQRAYERREKTQRTLVGVTICWPDASFDQPEKRTRRARQLHTSARFLEAFQEKAELIDVDKEQFEQEFLRVRGDSLPFLSPGFSQQFVEYFNNREKSVFEAEKKKLDSIKAANVELKKKQDALLAQFKQLEKSSQEKQAESQEAVQNLQRLYDSLVQFGVQKLKKPECLKQETPKKKSRARTTSEMSATSPVPKTEKITLHSCGECKKNSDQHQLIHCDACKLWFHLRCLDPPLEKMPKKTNYEWYCSTCCESSDEESDSRESDRDGEDDEGVVGVRRLRQRDDAMKALRMKQAQEQARDFRAAITSRGALPRGRKSAGSDPATVGGGKTADKAQKRRTIEGEVPSKRRRVLPINGRSASRASVASGGESQANIREDSVRDHSPCGEDNFIITDMEDQYYEEEEL